MKRWKAALMSFSGCTSSLAFYHKAERFLLFVSSHRHCLRFGLQMRLRSTRLLAWRRHYAKTSYLGPASCAACSRSLAGKPLAGFCATRSRRIQDLYGMVVHVIRCNTH